MDTIFWFMERDLSIVCVFIGIYIFMYICRNGTGAVKEIIRTIGATLKALCRWLQDKLSTEKEEPEEEEEKERTYEIHLTAKQLEEFEQMMNSKDFHL